MKNAEAAVSSRRGEGARKNFEDGEGLKNFKTRGGGTFARGRVSIPLHTMKYNNNCAGYLIAFTLLENVVLLVFASHLS